jgi:hypothetical protein
MRGPESSNEPATGTAAGRAEQATRVRVLASGAVAVHVTDGALRRGTVVNVTVRRGDRILRQWQATVGDRGVISVTVPRATRATRIELRVGSRVIGLGTVGATR